MLKQRTPPSIVSQLTTGGVWLSNATMLINSEFDLQCAMALDVGPGLAAARRRITNLELSQEWLKGEPFVLETVRPALQRRNPKVERAWVALFGKEQKILITVVERELPQSDEVIHLIALSRRDSNGGGRASYANNNSTREEIRTAFERLTKISINTEFTQKKQTIAISGLIKVSGFVSTVDPCLLILDGTGKVYLVHDGCRVDRP